MVVVIGEPRLAGEFTRELLARRIDVVAVRDDEEIPARSTIVLAEGTHREPLALERALRAITLSGGYLVWATDRELDDPDVTALRRRGLPYTVVRSSGLVDLPPSTSTSFVLVPADLRRAPFATMRDLACAVAGEIEADRVGTGAVVDVTTHAGAHAWAHALREAGARAHVVPRWVAVLAGVFGVLRLELGAGRVTFVSGLAPSPRPARSLAAG